MSTDYNERKRIESYLQSLNNELNTVNNYNTVAINHNQHSLDSQASKLEAIEQDYTNLF